MESREKRAAAREARTQAMDAEAAAAHERTVQWVPQPSSYLAFYMPGAKLRAYQLFCEMLQSLLS